MFLPFQNTPPTKHLSPLYLWAEPFEEKKKYKKEYTSRESQLPYEKKVV